MHQYIGIKPTIKSPHFPCDFNEVLILGLKYFCLLEKILKISK